MTKPKPLDRTRPATEFLQSGQFWRFGDHVGRHGGIAPLTEGISTTPTVRTIHIIDNAVCRGYYRNGERYLIKHNDGDSGIGRISLRGHTGDSTKRHSWTHPSPHERAEFIGEVLAASLTDPKLAEHVRKHPEIFSLDSA